MSTVRSSQEAAGGGQTSAAIVFTLTIFLSAALLFFVQPLFARIVLPVLGGAPAVWTTAMLFFQSVLIGGYLYAHLLIRYVPVRAQLGLHLAFWCAALWFLPLGLPDGWTPDPSANAAFQALGLFALGVGVPFAVLSANAPLLQAWYGRSNGPSADDPYFLYAASNLGSLVALLAFPLVAEPLFGATAIGRGFAVGFTCLGAGLLATGLMAGRGQAQRAAKALAATPITARRVAYWMLLAFVPSSMMLAVTTKISTDIGSLPLVWVIPLALYLLTFVIAFRDRKALSMGLLRLLGCVGVAWLTYVFSGHSDAHLTLFDGIALMTAFFAVSLFAHGALYDDRPAGSQLTIFYLVMSVGGAVGGLFNSLIGPALFDTLVEGAVTTLVAVALLLPASFWPAPNDRARLAMYLCTALLALLVAITVLGADGRTAIIVLTMVLAVLPLLIFALRPRPTAISAVVILSVGLYALPKEAIFQDRSFFGTHKVVDHRGFRQYVNGTTVHGMQRISDLESDRPVPMTYYHPDGPLAEAVKTVSDDPAARIGIVGLGAGALACYTEPGQVWDYYEIDPVVDRVARDPKLFTYMDRCAGDAPTHLGDARLVLQAQSGKLFDVLIIDAYSSDAVPVHLTTLEAMDLYLSRLAPGGILVFHVSNRYFDIQLALGRLAAERDLIGYYIQSPAEAASGKAQTDAVVLARSDADLGPWHDQDTAKPLENDGEAAWTDDYANVLGILRGYGGW